MVCTFPVILGNLHRILFISTPSIQVECRFTEQRQAFRTKAITLAQHHFPNQYQGKYPKHRPHRPIERSHYCLQTPACLLRSALCYPGIPCGTRAYLALLGHTRRYPGTPVIGSWFNMSISVHVGFLGGKKATVKADKDEQVEALSLRAQSALGVGRGRLVDSSGRALDACSTIEAAKIQNGDSLTLRINRLQIQSSCAAFAGLSDDGSVST